MQRPSKGAIKVYLSLGALLYVQFILVYGSANWLASRREEFYRLYFSWEQTTPFIPQFAYVYLSLSMFLLLPLFCLTENRLRAWAKANMVMTFIAGACFVALPAQLAVARSDAVREQHVVYHLLYSLDLPHNLFPSLHVAYATLALLVMLPLIWRRMVGYGILIWWGLLLLSVLLTRQHHLVDIVGGLVLALACYGVVYLKQPVPKRCDQN